ncbi:MAG: hypothetical protein P4L49_16565 [Desulfosporosinus sp.]|nr:hypothetical protein [Desulfosporosinus sp.]
MIKSQVRSVRFTGDNFEQATILAEMREQNVNRLINSLIEEKVNEDPLISKTIIEFATKFGTSESNQKKMALAMFYAKNDVQLETEGTGMALINGDVSFGNLCIEYKRQLMEEFERSMLPVIAEFEREGRPLDEKAKRIAIKYRIGKTWLESEEYKKEQTIQAEIARLRLRNDIENDNDAEWTGR